MAGVLNKDRSLTSRGTRRSSYRGRTHERRRDRHADKPYRRPGSRGRSKGLRRRHDPRPHRQQGAFVVLPRMSSRMAGVLNKDRSLTSRGTRRSSDRGRTHERRRDRHADKPYRRPGSRGRSKGLRRRHDPRPHRQQGAFVVLPRMSRKNEQDHWVYLEELYQKSASEIVASLSVSTDRFEHLMEKVSCKGIDLNVKILNVLNRALQSESVPHLLLEIINIVKNSNILARLINKVADEVLKTEDDHQAMISQIKALLSCLIRIFEKSPSDIVFICGINEIAGAMKHHIETVLSLQTDISEVQALLKKMDSVVEHCLKKHERQNENCDSANATTNERSFRDISVYPSTEDITAVNTQLPVNKIFGRYENCEQYLDTHFKLLREDFIVPMREGIASYFGYSGKNQKQLRDIRCYENVRILSAVPLDGINHLVSFDISKFRNFRWGLGSRLKFGSLLCFFQDGFQSCYFATVTGSRPKDLYKGQLTVKFNEDIETVHKLFGCNLLMVESVAYFEPYRHVLNALHGFSEDDLPFARYIVECENLVLPPAYFRQNPEIMYDLSDILEDEEHLSDDGHLSTYRDIKMDAQWPRTDETGLNESQLNAVKLALTKEFSLIQGPPGCGKTFVGLKIAKLLLEKRRVRGNSHNGKMLVVCYTNHALDQFMEGILNFYTLGLVRVGGRSKNEKLERYNLKTLRLLNRREKNYPEDGMRLKRNLYAKTQKIKRKLTSKALRKQVINEHIVHEDALKTAMGYKVHRQFRVQNGKPMTQLSHRNSAIVNWLGIDKIVSRLYTTVDVEAGLDLTEYTENGDRNQEILGTEEGEGEGEGYRQLQDEIKDFKTKNLAIDFDSMVPVTDHKEKQKWRSIIMLLRQEVRNEMCNASIEGLKESEISDSFIYFLPNEQRWNLYCYWISSLSNQIDAECSGLEEKYNKQCKLLNEARMQEDVFILRTANVIGMTTTCAARIKPILIEIKPTIIIIEEAAEVLEAHVTSTLTKDCEHLILIGDHKQLRPKPSVYRLETEFNLGISMFERLVRNKIEYRSLNVQRRMRPEIANLIRFIYHDLKDHATVCQYEKVKGIKHNVFFVSHKHTESQDTDIAGYHNTHEADYMLTLCKYLLKQGYTSSQITILTAYKGQFSKLKRGAQNEDDVAEVAIKVIDDYQGEENDIILLSFVRSNERSQSGFLKESNRVCVALSRAKMGLFAIGDFDMYSKSSGVWQKIVNHLKMQNQIGIALPLQCQNHPNMEPLMVETADDFKNSPDGGCKRKCDYRLECGHVCKRRCHPYDREHKDYRCMEHCYKSCANNHPCMRRCSDVCRCNELIVRKLDCGHEISVPCENENDSIECMEKCTKTLPCGHECTRKCSDRCDPCRVDVEVKFPGCGHLLKTPCFLKDKPCTIRCQETLNCGHTCLAKCSSTSNNTGTVFMQLQRCKRGHTKTCQEDCKKILACGHSCSGTCNNCHSNGFHTLCAKECKCTIICGHACEGQCQSCELCTQRCDRKCVHGPLGDTCKEECRRCQEPCPWVCSHLRCTKKCGEPCDRQRCNEPCMIQLPCKHTCSGLCGDPCPPVCVKCGEAEIAVFKDHDRQGNISVVQLDDCGHLIQRELMDQYIDSEDPRVLKKCLVCSKTIYTTNGNRYEHDLNTTFAKIDKIKRRLCLFSCDNNPIDFQEVKFYINKVNRRSVCSFLSSLSSEATDMLNKRMFLMDSFGDQIITDLVECLNRTVEVILASAINSVILESSPECESIEERYYLHQQQQIIFLKRIILYDLDSLPDCSIIEHYMAETVEQEIQKLNNVMGQLNCVEVDEHDDVSISSDKTTSSMASVAGLTERDTQEEVNDDEVEERCPKPSQSEDVSSDLQKRQSNNGSVMGMSSVNDEYGRPSPDRSDSEALLRSLDVKSHARSRQTVIHVPYVKTTSRYFQNKKSSDVFKKFKSMTEVIKLDNKKERKRVNALETQDKSTHAVPSKRSKLSLVSSSVVTPQTSERRTEGRKTLDTPVTPKPSEHRTEGRDTLDMFVTPKTSQHRTEGRSTLETPETPKQPEHRTEGRKTLDTVGTPKPSEHRTEGHDTLDMSITPKTSEHRNEGRTLETPETPKPSEHRTEGRETLDTSGTHKTSEHHTEVHGTLHTSGTHKTPEYRTEGRDTLDMSRTPKAPEHCTEGPDTLDTSGTHKTPEHRNEGRDKLDTSGTPKTPEHRNKGRGTLYMSRTPKTPEHRTKGRKTLDTSGTHKTSEHHTEVHGTLHTSGTHKTPEHRTEGRDTLDMSRTPKTPEHRTEGRETLDTAGTPKTPEYRTEGRDTLDMSRTPKAPEHCTEGPDTLDTSGTHKTPEHRNEGRDKLDTSGTPKTPEHRNKGRGTLYMSRTPKTPEHRTKGRKTLDTSGTHKTSEHHTEVHGTLHTSGTHKTPEHRTEGRDTLDMSRTPKTPEHRTEGRETLDTAGTPKTQEHRTEGRETFDMSRTPKPPEHRTEWREPLDMSRTHKTPEHRNEGRDTLDTSGTPKTPEHRNKGRGTLNMSRTPKTPEHRTKGRKILDTSGTHKTSEHHTEVHGTLHTSGSHKTPEHRTEGRDTLDMSRTPKTPEHRTEGRETLDTAGTPKTQEHRTEGRETFDMSRTPKPPEHRTEWREPLDMSRTHKTPEHRNEGRDTLHTSGTHKTPEHSTEGRDTLDMSRTPKTPEHSTEGHKTLDTSGTHKTSEHYTEVHDTLHTSGTHKTPEHRTEERYTLYTFGRHKTSERRTELRFTLHTSGRHKTSEHRAEGRDTLYTSGRHKTSEHRAEGRDTLYKSGTHKTSERRTELRYTLHASGRHTTPEHCAEGRDTLYTFGTHTTSERRAEGRDSLCKSGTHKTSEHRAEGRDTLYKFGTHTTSERRAEGRDTLCKSGTHKTSEHRAEGRDTLYKFGTQTTPEHHSEGRDTLYKSGTHKTSEHRAEGRDTLYKFGTHTTSERRAEGRGTLCKSGTHKTSEHRAEGRDTLYKFGTQTTPEHHSEGRDTLYKSGTHKTSEHRAEGRDTLYKSGTHKTSERRTEGRQTLDMSRTTKTLEHKAYYHFREETVAGKCERQRNVNQQKIQDNNSHPVPSKKSKLSQTGSSVVTPKASEHRTEVHGNLDTSRQLIPASHRTISRNRVETITTECDRERYVEEKQNISLAYQFKESTPERQSSHHGSSHHRSRSHHRSSNHRSSFHRTRDSSKIQSSEEKPLINKFHPNTQASGQDGSADVTQPVNVHELDPDDLRWMLLARRSRPLQNIWTS